MKRIEAQFAEGTVTGHSAAPKGGPSARP
jgi:hypothetical protein